MEFVTGLQVAQLHDDNDRMHWLLVGNADRCSVPVH